MSGAFDYITTLPTTETNNRLPFRCWVVVNGVEFSAPTGCRRNSAASLKQDYANDLETPTPLSASRYLDMESVQDAARVSGPHESELERTIQELNSRKRQLEDALHQVCFQTMPHASAALLIL